MQAGGTLCHIIIPVQHSLCTPCVHTMCPCDTTRVKNTPKSKHHNTFYNLPSCPWCTRCISAMVLSCEAASTTCGCITYGKPNAHILVTARYCNAISYPITPCMPQSSTVCHAKRQYAICRINCAQDQSFQSAVNQLYEASHKQLLNPSIHTLSGQGPSGDDK